MSSFNIEKEILIGSPMENVFSVLTDSNEIPIFYPLKSVESDWVEGNEVIYKGEINGIPFTDYGVIEKISVPDTYRYRYWSDNHGTERIDENYLTIEYRLESVPGATKVSVTQSNIQSQAMYEMMQNQVWDYLLASLKTYIENRI